MAITEEQKKKSVNVELLQYFKSKQDAVNAATYVAKNGTDSLMTADEHTKLAGIAEGAQVNVLEGVKVNGEALTATDKVVDVTVAEGTTDGSILVNGKAVAVHGAAAAISAVNTLVGDDSNKSARTIANEELAKQLIPENASEALDTLAEIAAWIQAHPGDASAMNTAIGKLQAIIAGIGGEGDTYATVVAALADKVDKETGKSLLSDTEITRLSGMSTNANKTEVSAQFNSGLKVGSVSIDGVATDIYVPVATTADIDALFAAE